MQGLPDALFERVSCEDQHAFAAVHVAGDGFDEREHAREIGIAQQGVAAVNLEHDQVIGFEIRDQACGNGVIDLIIGSRERVVARGFGGDQTDCIEDVCVGQIAQRADVTCSQDLTGLDLIHQSGSNLFVQQFKTYESHLGRGAIRAVIWMYFPGTE